MKVVRAHLQSSIRKGCQASCFDVDHVVLALERPSTKRNLLRVSQGGIAPMVAYNDDPVEIRRTGEHFLS